MCSLAASTTMAVSTPLCNLGLFSLKVSVCTLPATCNNMSSIALFVPLDSHCISSEFWRIALHILSLHSTCLRVSRFQNISLHCCRVACTQFHLLTLHHMSRQRRGFLESRPAGKPAHRIPYPYAYAHTHIYTHTHRHAYTHVHITHVHMYTRTCVYIYIYTHTHLDLRIHMCKTYIHTGTHLHIHIHRRTHAHTHTRVHTYMYIYIYSYIYIYKSMHTYRYA